MTKNFPFLTVAAAVLAFSAPAHAARSDWQTGGHAKARLIAVPAGMIPVASGNPDHAYGAIDITLDSGWHAYWRMPGEGGLAPVVKTEASENLKELKLIWPKPRRYETYGMHSFGYDSGFMLPFEIAPVKAGAPVKLDFTLDIMVCNDICIPETVKIALEVPKDKSDAQIEDARIIDAGLGKAPVEKDTERLKIENLVLGPEALVITAFSQTGFDRSDLFVELIGAKQDIYLTAPPQVTIDAKDKRKAIMRIAAPMGVGNLANLLSGGKVILTLSAGNDAVTKSFQF